MNVLLIDDRAVEKEILSRVLPQKYNLLYADSVSQALVSLNEADAVIVDYWMTPEGLNTAEAVLVAGKERNIPTVIYSGDATGKAAEAAEKYGLQLIAKNTRSDSRIIEWLESISDSLSKDHQSLGE